MAPLKFAARGGCRSTTHSPLVAGRAPRTREVRPDDEWPSWAGHVQIEDMAMQIFYVGFLRIADLGASRSEGQVTVLTTF